MVLKNDIFADLKKYNKELEKHISGVDFSFISKNPKLFTENKNEEYFSLLATNLSDLRTEFALFRKNFAADIEGMVLNSIAQQQSQFISQMNKFHGNIIADLKSNFSEHILEMNESILGLKKEFLKVQTQNGSFNARLNDFTTDLTEFKSLIVKLDLKLDNSNVEKSLGEKMELMSSKFDIFTDEINKKNNTMFKNVKTFNTKLYDLEKESLDLKVSNSKSDKVIGTKLYEIFNKNLTMSRHIDALKQKISKLDGNTNVLKSENSNYEKVILNKIDEVENKFKSISNRNNVISKNIVNLNKKIVNIENNNNNSSNNQIISDNSISNNEDLISVVDETIHLSKLNKINSNKIDKLLEIDTRIKNLNSLR